MTFIQISTLVFLLSLFRAQIFPGQNPYTSHFGSERGEAIYITGKFPCMEKLSQLSVIAGLDLAWGESYPWVGLLRSCPVLEALPGGSPRQDDACRLGSLPWASPPVPAHTLGSRRT